MAIIIVLVIRDSENRDVIRVLTLAIGAGDGDVIIIIQIRLARRSRTAIRSPDPVEQVAVFSELAVEELWSKETHPS